MENSPCENCPTESYSDMDIGHVLEGRRIGDLKFYILKFPEVNGDRFRSDNIVFGPDGKSKNFSCMKVDTSGRSLCRGCEATIENNVLKKV